MKIAIMAITRGGRDLAAKLAAAIPSATLLTGKGVGASFADNWQEFGGFICVMATGIVVRSIAPLLADKRTDPCVVVVDEKGHHAISLLSGHLGGGNELAQQVAAILGGEPVITTASDTLGLVALDVWARGQHLVASRADMTKGSGLLVNKGGLLVYAECEVASLPPGLVQTRNRDEADLIISNKTCYPDRLVLCPQNLVVGTGCNRGTPVQEFSQAMAELFRDLGLNVSAIRNLASIDKKNDEAGLLGFAEQGEWPIDFFNKEAINQVSNVDVSPAAMQAVGAIGVAEPCALLSAMNKQPEIRVNLCSSVVQENIKLISRKRKWQNITMAVAERPFTLSAQGLAR
jgi:cobalt-precorrin 5A hydrolase